MGSKARAKFIDGTLSVFCDGKIWCTGLATPSAFEVREARVVFRNGTTEQEIFHFDKRAQAEAALDVIAQALTEGHKKRRGFFGKLFTVTLVFVAVLGVLLLISRVTARDHAVQPQQPAAAIEKDEPRAGVPVPADELLDK